MSSSAPTHTISLDDYDKLRKRAEAAEAHVNTLQADVEQAKFAVDVDGLTDKYAAAFKEAVKIVQFATGNLDPATVAGWPVESLRAVADAIKTLPKLDIYTREVASVFTDFARLATGYEELRKQRKLLQAPVMAGPADFGPQTPEARAIHSVHRNGGAVAETSAPATAVKSETVHDGAEP